MNRVVFITHAMAVLLATSQLAAQRAPLPRFDLLLRNGTVIDGTGAAPVRADVGIIGKHIARVGNLAGADAALVLDVNGLSVAPGFINLHSHASMQGLPTAENMLTQGVTTEILNPDGGGRIDIARQLDEAQAAGLAVNVGANIGFNSIWTSTVGESDRRPSAEELARMRELLIKNLEQGAWGVSAGLDYKPAYFATTEEVIEVVKAAAPWRTNFTNHDRVTPESRYSSRAGMAETMLIGQRAGLLPVITHMKVQGREQGTAADVLRMMRQADAAGQYTAADVYPYLAGQSGLGALIIPAWAQDGGRERMLERFKDPAQRARIVADAEEAMAARFGGPQGVYLPGPRRELTDVMKELNVSAGEAVVRILEEGNAGAILRFGSEPDLVKILQHPSASIACDCGATPPGRASHPRYYGTYPRVLGRYVRDTKALTWQEAVRKMTLLPAATIGMIDRGVIAPGMAADITVFDPKTVIDHATFEQPALPSDGIRYVIVNGGLALRDGQPTGERHGAALRRHRHMPSRPLDLSRTRRATAKGNAPSPIDDGAWEVSIDLNQAPASRTAAGTLRLKSVSKQPRPQTVLAIDAVAFGMLQAANGWASVTGRARVMPKNEERNFVAVFDHPRAEGREGNEGREGRGSPEGAAMVRIDVDGVIIATATLPAGSVRVTMR